MKAKLRWQFKILLGSSSSLYNSLEICVNKKRQGKKVKNKLFVYNDKTSLSFPFWQKFIEDGMCDRLTTSQFSQHHLSTSPLNYGRVAKNKKVRATGHRRRDAHKNEYALLSKRSWRLSLCPFALSFHQIKYEYISFYKTLWIVTTKTKTKKKIKI